MKTLKKLSINSGKFLTPDELKSISGGGTCTCYTGDYMTTLGTCGAPDYESCMWCCWTSYPGYGSIEWNYEG